MNDCPNCEYNKQRAQRWREEAYKQSGHPLSEREWVGLTDEEIAYAYTLEKKFAMQYVDAKLKEKNT